MANRYAHSVFINCPFDAGYKPIHDAIVFSVFDCGFVPRSALELDDGSDPRLLKILRLMTQCRLAIHDISRVQLDEKRKLPRFNMPFELGLFFGIKAAEGEKNAEKERGCVIFDSEQHRYKVFLSDISGQDIHAHGYEPRRAIIEVRNWLANYSPDVIPGGEEIWKRYQAFSATLPDVLRSLKLRRSSMNFRDYTHCVSLWLRNRLACGLPSANHPS